MTIFSLHTEARFQAQLKAALTAQEDPIGNSEAFNEEQRINDVKNGLTPPASLGLNPALAVVSIKVSTDFKKSYIAPFVPFCIFSFSTIPSHHPFCICLHLRRVQVSKQTVNPPYLSTSSHSPTEGKESTKYLFVRDRKLSCRVHRASFIAACSFWV